MILQQFSRFSANFQIFLINFYRGLVVFLNHYLQKNCLFHNAKTYNLPFSVTSVYVEDAALPQSSDSKLAFDKVQLGCHTLISMLTKNYIPPPLPRKGINYYWLNKLIPLAHLKRL